MENGYLIGGRRNINQIRLSFLYEIKKTKKISWLKLYLACCKIKSNYKMREPKHMIFKITFSSRILGISQHSGKALPYIMYVYRQCPGQINLQPSQCKTQKIWEFTIYWKLILKSGNVDKIT